MGIRVVVIDDNPHVRWEGRVYPVNATFQHFAAGLLALPGAPVVSVTSCVPLREAVGPPMTLPLDPRIRVVGTEPFDGIKGYLRRLPSIVNTNRPILAAALGEADITWVKVPASNAALAAVLALKLGVPRFVWVAGSARDVGAARYAGIRRLAASIVGALYDLVGWVVAIGGERVVVGRDLDRDGIVASLVERSELREPSANARWAGGPLRLAWAGRVAEGKGLEWLFEAIARMDRDIELTIIGDGPAREMLEAKGATLGLTDRLRWVGYIAERKPYLDNLAGSDAFVFASKAEGFPKVVLDAMAVGLPVLARRTGALRALDAVAPLKDLERDIAALDSTGPNGWHAVAWRGYLFAQSHTRDAELSRLVDRWLAKARDRQVESD